tara:strand:+ start:16435 stop:17328 length:894 start_codon:yes stop_codon:yes gene_type:complete
MSLLNNLTNKLSVKEVTDQPSSNGTHGEDYLKSIITSMDSKPEVARVGGDYLHLTSLIGICARKHILANTSNMEFTSVPKSSDRVLWAFGRAAENHVRAQFIKAMNREDIYGMWVCDCGEVKYEGYYYDYKFCGGCGSKAIHYEEVTLFDNEAKIAGNPDLIYKRPDNNKLRVVECKSINRKGFESLDSPKPDHVHQAMGYSKLLKLNGFFVDDAVTIFYVNKEWSFKSPYKEFHVDSNHSHDLVLDMMWDRARVISNTCAMDNPLDELPGRLPVCSSCDTSVAKSCECVDLCFAYN